MLVSSDLGGHAWSTVCYLKIDIFRWSSARSLFSTSRFGSFATTTWGPASDVFTVNYWGVHKRSDLLTFHLYSSNSSETHQTDCSFRGFHHTFTMLLLSRGVKPTFLCLVACNHNYLCALEYWLVNTCHQCLRACVRFKDLDHQTWGEVLIIHLSPSVGADFSPLL